MSKKPSSYKMFATMGNPVDDREHNHMLLQLQHDNDPTKSNWLHVTGGPQVAPGQPFKYLPQADKSFDSKGFGPRIPLGDVQSGDLKKVTDAAKRQPVPDASQGQNCQNWTHGVVSDLEGRGILNSGSADSVQQHIDTHGKNPNYQAPTQASATGAPATGAPAPGSKEEMSVGDDDDHGFVSDSEHNDPVLMQHIHHDGWVPHHLRQREADIPNDYGVLCEDSHEGEHCADHDQTDLNQSEDHDGYDQHSFDADEEDFDETENYEHEDEQEYSEDEEYENYEDEEYDEYHEHENEEEYLNHSSHESSHMLSEEYY